MKKLLSFLLMSTVMTNLAMVVETPMPDQRHKVAQLDPVVTKFNPNGSIHYGLDIDSMKAVYPELVSGTIINYSALIPILIEVIQKLLNENNNQNAMMQEQIRKLEALLLELQ